jgi:hypothetical protein
MSLTELEEHVFAYFLSIEAPHISVDGRFYRRDEFVRVFEDRIFYATQRLGAGVSGRHTEIVNSLIDTLIEAQALSTSHDRLSGTYHKMDDNKYRAVIRNLIQSNALCQRAQQVGAHFWQEAFKALNPALP